MFFAALATDFDDTIALSGVVDDDTLAALEAVKHSGRKLLLVTGRELPELLDVFPAVGMFDLVVAENGGLLYDPMTREETPIAAPHKTELRERLLAEGIEPLSFGRSIIATRQPHEIRVLEVIKELGLEAQIIFNKGAVMVLPPGINKASGLAEALERLCLSPHNVVGIGDAENDHAFLQACGCRIAVANALDALKRVADLVTSKPRGAGVGELARLLIETDMAGLALERRRPLLGHTPEGAEVRLDPTSGPVLVLGASGGGKSTTVQGLVERLGADAQQCCIFDPEGDYAELEGVVVAGGPKEKPQVNTASSHLRRHPEDTVAVNMIAIDANSRPQFFAGMLTQIAAMRTELGRPHWLLIDEAHHVMPANWGPAAIALPMELPATVAVTIDVELLTAEFVERIELLVAVGTEAGRMVEGFCRAVGSPVPDGLERSAGKDGAYLYRRDGSLTRIRIEPPVGSRRRHARKYAEGELDYSFYFRGPHNKLKLKAQNLILFQQIAEGVDDESWLHHLRAGDYSRWFREAIKDEDLAAAAQEIETDASIGAEESRRLIGDEISKRYTAPAKAQG